MPLGNYVLKKGDSIDLPALLCPKIKQSIGFISHMIKIKETVTIISTEEISVSIRKQITAFVLSNGEKIIITSKKKLECPVGINGILSTASENTLNWIFHVDLEKFKARIPTDGLENISKEFEDSWINQFRYTTERRNDKGEITIKGLRPPQIGGLHAIGSHWSLTKEIATIIMPTGTGKTETMLATLIAHNPGRTLIVVPSKVLRDQTTRKFISLGLLRDLGNIKPDLVNPIVGVIENRPQTDEDLQIFDKCNVVISTMSALADESARSIAPKIASKITTLIVDEAHHIAAESWLRFREAFKKNNVLQFTATPYRRDGKLVDGKPVFQYSLGQAQEAGYFKPISFEPVYEIDQEDGDKAIAEAAVQKLRSDISAGLDHIVMARCENIKRAKDALNIYLQIAPDFNPIIVHSKESGSGENLDQIFKRESRIVVCVNMLGEGFDLPQLKIAAVHDTHKSLAILLQFTGRFTRTSAKNIGNATVIANIASQEVSSALERLYSEDSDWNLLLSEFSSEAAKSHTRLIDFLNSSKRLDEIDMDNVEVSHHLLRPIMSTLTFNADKFTPKDFYNGLPNEETVHQVWLNEASNTLFFITKQDLRIRWSRSKTVFDRVWNLFILHYDSTRNLLFLSSSDKSSMHEPLAKAVGANSIISGDIIFRSLGRITRLIFRNVGVRKHGRRNLSFASYTGADVTTALSMSERQGSSKNNLDGSGWEQGKPITIGCSVKGRIWARDAGTIPELIDWCENLGDKLKDTSINTTDIISHVLIPKEITEIEEKPILCVEWPIEILRESEERVVITGNQESFPISMVEIGLLKSSSENNRIEFNIYIEEKRSLGSFILCLDAELGFFVQQTVGVKLKLEIGARPDISLEDYFSNYPPLIRFVDLSELNGNLLIEPQNMQNITIPVERFEAWNWDNVDITKESIIKNNSQRQDSIQWHAAQYFINSGFELVFNDDAPGEAADLICIKEEEDFLRLILAHCKFTTTGQPGERIKDITEVCAQAIKSVKWKWKFKDLCHHVLTREKRLSRNNNITRFLKGDNTIINRLVKISRFKEIRPEIIIIQPGVSKSGQSADQTAIFAATLSYLKETIGCDLDIICSS